MQERPALEDLAGGALLVERRGGVRQADQQRTLPSAPRASQRSIKPSTGKRCPENWTTSGRAARRWRSKTIQARW